MTIKLRSLVLLLTGYLLILFTIPYISSFYEDLSMDAAYSKSALKENSQSKDFLAEVKEIEESENETDEDRFDEVSFVLFYLLHNEGIYKNPCHKEQSSPLHFSKSRQDRQAELAVFLI